jgi:hypothetical protein
MTVIVVQASEPAPQIAAPGRRLCSDPKNGSDVAFVARRLQPAYCNFIDINHF